MRPLTKIKTTAEELLIIVGMPGSGKTTYARSLVQAGELQGFSDDYEYGPINDWHPQMRPEDQEMLDALATGKRWAIADTRYCDPHERSKLEDTLGTQFPGLRFRYVYFENNPEQCVQNATVRKGGELPRHEIQLIYYYTELYGIPEDATVFPVPEAQPALPAVLETV